MKIEILVISNWRSIQYLEIEFQDLMIFIGQNNHGKSNVLSALLFFFSEKLSRAVGAGCAAPRCRGAGGGRAAQRS